MLTIYSPVQRTHHPAYVIKQGKRSTSFDLPERVDSILSVIRDQELGPVIAPDDAGLELIRTVHDPGMIEYLMTAYEQQTICERKNTKTEVPAPVFPSYFPPSSQRRRPSSFEGQKGFYCTNMGVPIDADTWRAAVASAHCAIAGARALQSGESCVYALCRPPGHHAGPDFFGGYCYLNNAAIAAQVLLENNECVAIVDIDYHHGNGTQAIFYAEPGVWYGSLHIDPSIDYPFFAGYADEIGSEAGEGTNRNVPLPPGTSQGQYLCALEILLVCLTAFNPQYLIVSAGFDTYIEDPIGTFQLTTEGFNKIGRLIRTLNLPMLVIQEGGYCVPDLGRNVTAFLKGVADFKQP